MAHTATPIYAREVSRPLVGVSAGAGSGDPQQVALGDQHRLAALFERLR
jgi:hypothetical protein